MKKYICYLILCSFLSTNCLVAHDEIFYTDEDDELFNRGKFVGQENKDYFREQKRARSKNWAFAVGAAVLGTVTLYLVSQNHDK